MTITLQIIASGGASSDNIFPGTVNAAAAFSFSGPTNFSGGVQGAELTFGNFIWNARGPNTSGTPSTVTASQGGFAGSIEHLEEFALSGGVYNNDISLDATPGLVFGSADRLFANQVLAGDDSLIGAAGADVLRAYAGNDTLEGGGGADTIDGGTGFDTLAFHMYNASLTANIGGVVVNLGDSSQNSVNVGADVYISIEAIEGTEFGQRTLGQTTFTNSGDDQLTGDGADNLLSGLAGDDTLVGGGGNDTLDGGAGNDVLDGGASIDTVDYSAATGALFVTLSLPGSGQAIAGLGTDTLTNIENLVGGDFADKLGGDAVGNVLTGGNGDDQLFGVAGNDTLLGGSGDDTLYGGTGNDSMVGGVGDDVYQVDSVNDLVVESAGQGNDIAFVLISGWTQGLNTEASYLVGSASLITGSSGNDVLVANASIASTLNGGGGNDTLWSQGQGDTLSGGAGADVLRGSGGVDRLTGGAGNDQLVGGAGGDFYAYDTATWGYDQIYGFNSAAGDKLDFRGSGIASMSDLALYGASGSTVITHGADRIDLYGVTSLSASNFIFS